MHSSKPLKKERGKEVHVMEYETDLVFVAGFRMEVGRWLEWLPKLG